MATNIFFLMIRRPPRSTLFPSTTLSRTTPAATIKLRHYQTRPRPTYPRPCYTGRMRVIGLAGWSGAGKTTRSEEHTSELQSRQYLVCRLLLEKKKNRTVTTCVLQVHVAC